MRVLIIFTIFLMKMNKPDEFSFNEKTNFAYGFIHKNFFKKFVDKLCNSA